MELPIPRWLWRASCYCVALLVLAVTLWLLAQAVMRVQSVTFALVAALLLAALLSPLADLFRKARTPPWVAALLSVVTLLAVLAASMFLLVSRALAQVKDLREAVSQALVNLQDLVRHLPVPISDSQLQQLQGRVKQYALEWLPSPTSGATIAVEILAAAVLALFVLFFLLKEGAAMWRWAITWTPSQYRAVVDGAGQRAWATLTRYVRGTVAVAFIDALGVGAAMVIMGVPLATSLTLIVFIGAFVPIVGATVSGLVAIGVTLVTLGPIQAAILLGVVLLVQQIEGNILQPWIMGHAVKLHPVVIVLAVTIGTLLAGILGAIVAVPLVAVWYRMARFLAGHDGPADSELSGESATTGPGG